MLASLDYGLRRIGAAIADPRVRIAHPRPAFIVYSQADAVTQVSTWLRAEHITRLYIGRPVSALGKPTSITAAVEDFVAALRTVSSVEILYVDERLSTKQTIRQGIAKENQDSAAAALLLESALARV